MSSISGKRLAFMTIEALQGMRNDRDFHLFFELITKKASSTSSIKQPELPRKRKRPDYSILQFFELDSLLDMYGADIDSSALLSELLLLRTICKDGNPSHFDDILTSL